MMRFRRERSLSRPGLFDIELLKLLKGRRLSGELRCLYAIGCHRFEEKALIEEIFPNLRHIVLFEPLPEPLVHLRALAAVDSRVRVIPCAIGASDGKAEFHVTTNDGESSSLLPLGKHQEVFPWVAESCLMSVDVRKLGSVVREQSIPPPDLLIVDVQGAEYDVIASIDEDLLRNVRLIYTEVSTEPLYVGGRPLADVEALLQPSFQNVGFVPLMPNALMHGNAVFVRHNDSDRLLEPGVMNRIGTWFRG